MGTWNYDLTRNDRLKRLRLLRSLSYGGISANVENCLVMLIVKLLQEVDMATLRTSWLNEPLPPQILEDSSWMRIVHFFLIESPCPGQSNRKNNDIDKWAPAPWVGTRSLKTSLNQAIFSRRDVDVMLSVGSKKELEGACKKLNLDELFYENVDDQRMVFVKVNSKGNTSKNMSLFYHIRNALAHGRFAFKTDSLERFVFIFEDGTVASDCKKFNLTARGVIRLNSLILAIDTIQKGPGKTVDIEEKILAAISEGVNTRRKIKGELGITDKDWCIYSQVLKKEGKIECSQQKWSICSGE